MWSPNSRTVTLTSVLATAVLVMTGLAVASPAAAATIASTSVGVVADGTGQGTANGCLVENADTTLADLTPTDGVVCTDDSVTFGWNYSVEAAGAGAVTFTQTLPAGWTWDVLSLTSCAGGDDFTGTGSISVDQRTITCVLDFPNTGSARSGQLPVFATPQPGVLNESVYIAELTVTQSELGAPQVSTAGPVTVRSQPRWNVTKVPWGVAYFKTADFGGGPEAAVEVSYRIHVSAFSGNNFKGQDTLAPGASFIDDPSAIDPEALLMLCADSPAIATCTQVGGPGALTTITFGSTMEVPGASVEPAWTSPVAWTTYIRYVIPQRNVPTYPVTESATNQVYGFDPDGTGGDSNMGAGYETGSEPGATCDTPGNDDCATLPVTGPPSGTTAYPAKGLRLYPAAPGDNCSNLWSWCAGLEGATGVVISQPTSSNQDGVAYRGDRYIAGFDFQGSTNFELAQNPMICDKWDPVLQHIDPTGFAMAPVSNSGPESSWQYTNRTYADDAERQQAGCGSLGDPIADGPWFNTIDEAGGPSAVTGARRAVEVSTGSNGPDNHATSLPMVVASTAPTGVLVADFLSIYYDQNVDTDNPDGWEWTNTDAYRVNELRLAIDKDTDPKGTTGAVVGDRVPFTLDISASVVETGESRLVEGVTVIDELDSCYAAAQLSAATTAWSMAVTPGDPGPDNLACTADDVSGDTLTFTPTVPIMSNTPIQQIGYTVVISILSTNNQTLDNVAVVSGGGTLQSATALTDEWAITVAAPGAVRISKVADQDVVEINPDTISWTITYANTLGTTLGVTEFIDLLPYNGDGRGTDFDGVFGFDGAELLSGSDTTLFYTTDVVGTVAVDPAVNTSNWVESSVFAGTLADVTAVKIVIDELVSGEGGQVRIHAAPTNNIDGDVYDNSVSAGRAVGLSQPVPATLISEIRVVASSVGDRVWFDKNADGVQDAGESGIEGVTVRLFDGLGAELATTTTGADGLYSFAGYHSGDYRVVVDTSTLPIGFTDATYDLDSGTTAPDSDSDVFVLGFDTDRVDVDFGYVRLAPLDLTIAKVVEDAGAGWFGELQTFSIEVTCTTGGVVDDGFPQTVLITGTDEEIIDAPYGSTCAATETDDGGAHGVQIDPADGILIDGESASYTITVENTFEDGTLVIRKVIEGAGVIEFGSGPFEFSVVCTYEGDEVFDDEVTLTPGVDDTEMTSDEITEIPVGSVCVVTETDGGGSDALPAPVTVTILADETVTASLTNRFSAATVELEKVLDGDLADSPAATEAEFEVLVTCQVLEAGNTEPSTLFSDTVTIVGGEVIELLDDNDDPVLLPVGARCFIEETDAGIATTHTVSHADWASGAVVDASDGDEATLLSLTATNVFDDAQIVVSKTVVGPGAAGPYSFELVCTDDEGDEVPLADEDAAFQLSHGEQRVIAVPIGVDCAVSEVDVPIAATMSIVDSDAESGGGAADGVVNDIEGEENTVDIVNAYPPVLTGSLQHTGSEISGSVAGGLGTLALGAMLMGIALFARRRRSSQS